jgi:ribosomal protein S18 acetylase RimI-like enzyme
MVYSIEKTRVGALDASESIFDHFRERYPNFDQWMLQVSHRDAYAVKDGKTIVAFMIIKRESSYDVNGEIQPMIPKENHLKICSLCSIKEREGLGSVLLHKAIEVATAEHLPYIYFTLHKSNQNALTQLFFEKRGFEICGSTKDEIVYMKTISAIESEPSGHEIITEDYVGRTYNYTHPKTNRFLSVKITEDMVGKPLEEVLDEANAKAVESENKSKVNWRRLWRGVGKLSLEVFLVMWFIIFFNLGKKFDCAVLGFLSTYISLVPIHVFLWEGITQKLNKKAASKE